MNRQWAGVTFSTERIDDTEAGCSAIKLYRTAKGETKHVASVTFWDASGQYFVDTFHGDVPLDIFENFIAEAKQQIPVQ